MYESSTSDTRMALVDATAEIQLTTLEYLCQSKAGKESKNEDGAGVFTHRAGSREFSFAIVVDGATSKTKRTYGDKSPGRIARDAIINCVATSRFRYGAQHAVGSLQTAIELELADTLGLRAQDMPVGADRPEASFVMYSSEFNQLWRVGDCHMAYVADGKVVDFPGTKAIDKHHAATRSEVIVETLYRSSGVFTEEDLLSYDLGRASILGSLETQHVFANLDVSSEVFRFAVVSSSLATPRDLIEVYDVPANAAEIILCSDGYSRAHRTLDDAEADHARLIAVDPHRIFENPGTKGVAEGASSFDDRSYLRVALTRRN